MSSTPASCPATRPASPLGDRLPIKAASAPASRRGSFVKSKKNLPPIPHAPADALLRHTFSATVGTAPTGRGVLSSSIAPSPLTYTLKDATVMSKHRVAPSATFGTAASGRGLRTTPRKLPALPGPALIGREVAEAQLPHSYHATFGTGRTDASLRPACDVHSYLDHTNTLPQKHAFHATF